MAEKMESSAHTSIHSSTNTGLDGLRPNRAFSILNLLLINLINLLVLGLIIIA